MKRVNIFKREALIRINHTPIFFCLFCTTPLRSRHHTPSTKAAYQYRPRLWRNLTNQWSKHCTTSRISASDRMSSKFEVRGSNPRHRPIIPESLELIRIPNVTVTSIVNAMVIMAIDTRATGKNPLIKAVWIVK